MQLETVLLIVGVYWRSCSKANMKALQGNSKIMICNWMLWNNSSNFNVTSWSHDVAMHCLNWHAVICRTWSWLLCAVFLDDLCLLIEQVFSFPFLGVSYYSLNIRNVSINIEFPLATCIVHVAYFPKNRSLLPTLKIQARKFHYKWIVIDLTDH